MPYDTEMAHKRMFSRDITGSDAFRDMPSSTQNLYFHLGMEADDDGFLGNYKGLMRSVGSTDDDLKILLGKRFIMQFPSGVMVVKHWLINNTVRRDRYSETRYLEEKSALFIKDNKAYTDVATNGIPIGNQLATQKRIEEKRKEPAKAVLNSEEVREVRTNEDGEERPKKPKDTNTPQYEEICVWAEKRRGFPFVNRLKQYAALKKAKNMEIEIFRLKERWQELEGETWRNGFDWTEVVTSFDKRA